MSQDDQPTRVVRPVHDQPTVQLDRSSREGSTVVDAPLELGAQRSWSGTQVATPTKVLLNDEIERARYFYWVIIGIMRQHPGDAAVRWW